MSDSSEYISIWFTAKNFAIRYDKIETIILKNAKAFINDVYCIDPIDFDPKKGVPDNVLLNQAGYTLFFLKKDGNCMIVSYRTAYEIAVNDAKNKLQGEKYNDNAFADALKELDANTAEAPAPKNRYLPRPLIICSILAGLAGGIISALCLGKIFCEEKADTTTKNSAEESAYYCAPERPYGAGPRYAPIQYGLCENSVRFVVCNGFSDQFVERHTLKTANGSIVCGNHNAGFLQFGNDISGLHAGRKTNEKNSVNKA